MSKYGSSVAEASEELVAQWSLKNELKPENVKPGSQRKIIWEGPCGHEWVAPVDNRVYNGTGCPYCTSRGGKRLKPGLNDLATVNPELAREWHPSKNGEVTPDQTLPSVKVKYWWLCAECGREWEALLNMRHSRGTGCPSCRGRKRGVKVSGAGHWDRLLREWSPKNSLALEDYSTHSRERAHWECEKGHEWQAAIGDRNAKKTGCKQCGFGGTSRGEVELRDYVEGTGVHVRAHHRQIDPRFEYDIAVPAQGVAIEYNGLYWHTEGVKGADYHRIKSQAANEAGWQLIHVWEDDWILRPEVVKKMLARKLGVSDEEKLNARDLEVVEVGSPEARKFLNTYHIQGASGASVRLGLRDTEGDLRALITFRSRGNGVWELNRFASNAIVRGGFSRLFKHAVEATGAEKVVTFADRGVSDGGLYERCGFTLDGELPPDYMYVVKGIRVHKFNYRKARFKKDPDLKFEEGLTERELADLNGLDRIYDAGKVRWVWVKNK